ncbi:unnamed protein product [Gadus morhua 'NCC']
MPALVLTDTWQWQPVQVLIPWHALTPGLNLFPPLCQALPALQQPRSEGAISGREDHLLRGLVLDGSQTGLG